MRVKSTPVFIYRDPHEGYQIPAAKKFEVDVKDIFKVSTDTLALIAQISPVCSNFQGDDKFLELLHRVSPDRFNLTLHKAQIKGRFKRSIELLDSSANFTDLLPNNETFDRGQEALNETEAPGNDPTVDTPMDNVTEYVTSSTESNVGTTDNPERETPSVAFETSTQFDWATAEQNQTVLNDNETRTEDLSSWPSMVMTVPPVISDLENDTNELYIHTGYGGHMCGIHLQKGLSYLVFGEHFLSIS